jgi:hypothetical protein
MKAVIAFVFATFSLTGCVGNESTFTDPTGSDSGSASRTDSASDPDSGGASQPDSGGVSQPDSGSANQPDSGGVDQPDSASNPDGNRVLGDTKPDGDLASDSSASPESGATPEAGYDGPICCGSWKNAEQTLGLCGGVTQAPLCSDPDSGSSAYYDGLTCMNDDVDGGVSLTRDGGTVHVPCVLGGHCFFNSNTLNFGPAGECQGTVVACPYSCQ